MKTKHVLVDVVRFGVGHHVVGLVPADLSKEDLAGLATTKVGGKVYSINDWSPALSNGATVQDWTK